MANIAMGLKKRGNKNLYEANYAAAVECFSRIYHIQPDDSDNIIDLIYALNQNGDYVTALSYAYAMLGEYPDLDKLGSLYFLTAEAFGGACCIEGCAQMLERCLKHAPDGPDSRDARAFLNDLKQKYDVNEVDATTNQVQMLSPNSIVDAPFLNYETLVCMQEVSGLIKAQDFTGAIKRIEEEIDQGNVTISVLGVGMMLGAEIGDHSYIERNAQRFKFVEDYTVSELYALAYNITDLNDADVSYAVYRELYAKESGDKDIAFGFAVACERIGDVSRARDIASKVMASDGGRGPAKYYLETVGSKTHSFMLRYEGECEDKIIGSLANETVSNSDIFEVIDYLRFADTLTARTLINKMNADDLFCRLELRHAAMNSKINIAVRARAAARIYELGKCVYLNTGSDIVEFTPEIENVINNFFERGFNETVN